MEDLRLRCADMKAEAATALEQVAPLAARVKELEEELTRAAGEWDVLLSRADEALKAAEASRVDALAWKEKYRGEFCSLYFTCCFLCSAPNSLVWYRAGEGGFPGSRGLSGRGPALEGEGRGLSGRSPALERENQG